MTRLRSMLRNRVVPAAAFGVLLLCVFGAGALLLPHTALAQSNELQDFGAAAGLPQESIAIIIARLIRAFLGVLGIILVCLILYGGFLYMTAGGDTDKVKKAKLVLQNSIIGFVIIMLSFSIASFILGRLLDAAGLSGGIGSSAAAAYSEPLSGSLGAGIVQDHYPERNAIDIPRNTRIYITFNEAIDPDSLIQGYDEDASSTSLNTETVSIYQTAQLTEGIEVADISLTPTDVAVGFNDDFTIFTFDPVDLLGNATEDTNYTVLIGPGLRTLDGNAAFSGSYADGYEWTFEVSTEVDLTPPTVVSIIPSESTEDYDRNISVSLTFSEAMDPVASTGSYIAADGEFFSNIEVTEADGTVVEGTYEISNGYRTIDFTPDFACDQDPCGDTIYCLPSDEDLTVTAHAASVGDEPPQAVSIGASFDGLVDAASNSLDGNDDGVSQGALDDNSEDPDVADDFDWEFSTNDNINNTVPTVLEITPGILSDNVDNTLDVEIIFSVPMKASTILGTNIQLWPDPWYEFWFRVDNTSLRNLTEEATLDDMVLYTMASIEHPTLVSSADEGWDYYPLITKDVKSAYQICMFPAEGSVSPSGPGTTTTNAGSCAVDTDYPYCCNGAKSATACTTATGGVSLPDSSE